MAASILPDWFRGASMMGTTPAAQSRAEIARFERELSTAKEKSDYFYYPDYWETEWNYLNESYDNEASSGFPAPTDYGIYRGGAVPWIRFFSFPNIKPRDFDPGMYDFIRRHGGYMEGI